MSILANLPRYRPEVDLEKTLVSYVPPVSYEVDVNPIKILEAKKIIGSGPNTGLRTWEASLRLACYLHSHPELIQNRNVLELGAGTGFLSIFCAAFLNPGTVITTDGHEAVLESLKANIEQNAPLYPPGVSVEIEKLYWGDEDDLNSIVHKRNANHPGPEKIPPYDLIIGADISYDPEACKALASTLLTLTQANPDAKILISATQRNLKTLGDFLTTCQELSLRVEEVQYQVPPFDKQTGLFHNLVSPIQIFAMRYVPESVS